MDVLDKKDLDGASYEELLQIHIGVHHSLENSDDSEDDNCYSKVPVFDLQQIKAIAVNAKDLPSGDQSPLKSIEKCLGLEDAHILKIARNLSELISPSYCSVCLKHAAKGGMHYQSKNHFTNIMLWIESRTRTNDPNITKKIFCAPCNLPLVRENERHYSTKAHLKNEKFFCTVCFQIITHPMQDHIFQYHVNNAQSQDLIGITGNSLSCNRETAAKELKAKLTSSVCYLCKVDLKSMKHYRKQKHLKRMRAWIQKNSYRIGINTTNDQNSFYCEVCNEVFTFANLARQHYETMEHLKNLSTFCNSCRRHLSTRQSLREHYKKKHDTVILKPKATGQNLEELTKLSMCQLCTLTFDEAITARKHYQTSSIHAIRVFDFLEMNEAEVRGDSIGGHNSNSENRTCSKPNDHSTEAFENNDISESKRTNRTPDVCLTDVFDDNADNDNRKSEYSHKELDVESTEESENDDNEFEHLDSALKEQIMQEISLMMDKTYYSRSVSLQVVLEGLKTLNQQVADIIENNKILTNTKESSKTSNINSFKIDHKLTEVLSKHKSSSSSITKSPIDSANQDYAKLKLAIEVTRMKTNLEMFSVEVALRFAHGLRTLVMNVGKDNFDVEFIFSSPGSAVVYIPSVALKLLKIELEVLERRLTKSKRISVELALEIVTQFNERLEKEAEVMKKENKPFIHEYHECFKNTEECVADALPPLKSLSDDSVNAKESHMDKPINIDQDYAKLQLRTEITRMKTVLNENYINLIADALKYVRGFKMFIKKIQEKKENTFDTVDVGVVFLSTEAVTESAAGDLVLQRELAGLEWLLIVGMKPFGIELVLDIVKQFNIGLERLIEARKEDNDD
ncbi:uncharacterized protein [Euwallacea similis]|uniref:uncharacterized protein isoform X2 n=1 Tax=Euwallacea similis TaxID=1736056 RepID=UPI00344DC6DA